MKNILTRLFFLLLVVSMAISAVALDLPVKKVKGVQYFYYKVKKKETIYGISKNLGLTREEIVKHNPNAASGVKKGDLLLFPYEEYKEPEVSEVEEVVVVEDTVVPVQLSPAIAVALPFGTASAELSRQNKLALDFYKGLLLAADTLSTYGSPLEIHAFDIEAFETPEALCADSTLRRAAVVIAPADDKYISALGRMADETDAYIFNVLNVPDTTYMLNSHVIQANVPPAVMYGLAVDGMMQTFAGAVPVVLVSETGKNEKSSFTEYMIARYRETGVEPIIINYESALLSNQLDVLNVDAGQKYVVVPSSGSLAEFNKFAYVLKAFRDKLAELPADGDADATLVPELNVFGYPDWSAFRGDAVETLHKLDATIYSRFFDNFNGFDARILNNDFKHWYGEGIIESVPSQAILGFDTGCYLIRSIRANDGIYTPQYPASFEGVQSAFSFKKGVAGYYNNKLYLVRYNSDGTLTATVQ